MSEPTEPGQSLSEWAKAYLVDAAGKPLQMQAWQAGLMDAIYFKRPAPQITVGPQFGLSILRQARFVFTPGWLPISGVNLPEREESTPSYEEYMADCPGAGDARPRAVHRHGG